MKIASIKLEFLLLLISILGSLFVARNIRPAIAEKKPEPPPAIAEDDLVTKQGVRWGGQKWPYSKIVEIQDGLVGSPVGRVIIDRHGIDKND